MKINCLVLDDDPAYCRLVSSLVKEDKRLRLIGSFMEPEKAKECLLEDEIQLCFLDMEMPGMTGLELIKSLAEPPYVIFITSFKDFAADSYEVNAVDYLIKPLKEERFAAAVNKALERIETKEKLARVNEKESVESADDHFFVRADGQYVRIKYDDVIYIEALKDFVKIHTNDKTYVSLVSLKNIEASLPTSRFVRTHRSQLVNVKQISTIGTYDLKAGNFTLPLGESYKEEVLEQVVGNRLIKR